MDRSNLFSKCSAIFDNFHFFCVNFNASSLHLLVLMIHKKIFTLFFGQILVPDQVFLLDHSHFIVTTRRSIVVPICIESVFLKFDDEIVQRMTFGFIITRTPSPQKNGLNIASSHFPSEPICLIFFFILFAVLAVLWMSTDIEYRKINFIVDTGIR